MTTLRCFVLLALGTAGMARADQVTLKNGDRITGKIVKKDGASLVVKSDLFGEVKIPWDAVTGLTSDENLTVVLPEGKTVLGKVATTDKTLEVRTGTTTESSPLTAVGAMRNAAQQEQFERLEHPGWLDLWAGYVDFGLSLTRGNAETSSVNTAFNANRTTRTDRTTLYFNQIFARATVNQVTSTNAQAVRGGWAYNRHVNSRLLFSFFNDYEYDKFQGLDLRFVLGGGLGITAVKSDRQHLDLMAGFDYDRDRFSTGLTRTSGEFYWGDDWTYKLFGVTSLRQSYRMFDNLSDLGSYRMNFDFGAVTTLRKWLSLQLTVSDRFLSNPVPGRKKNDALFTTGLRFTFAQ